MRNDEAVIGEWIKGGEAFVFYREPGERVCHGIRAARSSLQSFEVFPSNDGKTGFVFAPFRFGDENAPTQPYVVVWLSVPNAISPGFT